MIFDLIYLITYVGILLFIFTGIQAGYAEEDDFFSTEIVADNVRGLIKPVDRAVISSEIAAKIDELPFKSGDRFKKGDVFDVIAFLEVVGHRPFY